MRDESHDEADDADVEHQGVEKQETNGTLASPRRRAEPKVDQGKHHAQKDDGQSDHSKASSIGRVPRQQGRTRTLRRDA
jgi:hypothetical protein